MNNVYMASCYTCQTEMKTNFLRLGRVYPEGSKTPKLVDVCVECIDNDANANQIRANWKELQSKHREVC